MGGKFRPVDVKRNEFLKLVPGSMTVAKYKKKYTELSKYAITIIADEADWCKRFEEGLWEEIRTLVTASAEWVDFSKLVEAAMCVERSLAERKIEGESVRSGCAIHVVSLTVLINLSSFPILHPSISEK